MKNMWLWCILPITLLVGVGLYAINLSSARTIDEEGIRECIAEYIRLAEMKDKAAASSLLSVASDDYLAREIYHQNSDPSQTYEGASTEIATIETSPIFDSKKQYFYQRLLGLVFLTFGKVASVNYSVDEIVDHGQYARALVRARADGKLLSEDEFWLQKIDGVWTIFDIRMQNPYRFDLIEYPDPGTPEWMEIQQMISTICTKSPESCLN